MDIRKAGMILEALVGGVDPRTGELLEAEHVCKDQQVHRALVEALELVKLRAKDLPVELPGDVDGRYVNKNGRLNGGRPWTREDDDMLRQLAAQGEHGGDVRRAAAQKARHPQSRGVSDRLEAASTAR